MKNISKTQTSEEDRKATIKCAGCGQPVTVTADVLAKSPECGDCGAAIDVAAYPSLVRLDTAWRAARQAESERKRAEREEDRAAARAIRERERSEAAHRESVERADEEARAAQKKADAQRAAVEQQSVERQHRRGSAMVLRVGGDWGLTVLGLFCAPVVLTFFVSAGAVVDTWSKPTVVYAVIALGVSGIVLSGMVLMCSAFLLLRTIAVKLDGLHLAMEAQIERGQASPLATQRYVNAFPVLVDGTAKES